MKELMTRVIGPAEASGDNSRSLGKRRRLRPQTQSRLLIEPRNFQEFCAITGIAVVAGLACALLVGCVLWTYVNGF